MLLGPVPHLDPDRHVERILPIGVLRRGLLFLYHFWPMVTAVSSICVMVGVMFGFPPLFLIGFQIELSSLLRLET